MTLHELLSKLDNIESYGLYFVRQYNPGITYSKDFPTSTHSLQDDIPNCTIQDVIKYLDYEVYKCSLGIFDNSNNTKYIRACIYLYC